MRHLVNDLRLFARMPRVTVNLMHSATADNDPFYERITREFYEAAQKPHPKMPLVKAWGWGVALCELPKSFDEYFMAIEASGRRNVRKAERLGYTFGRINYNDHLADIGSIRLSTTERQGRLPDELVSGEVKACANPPSRSRIHDYPYFGVLKDGGLVAYAGCLIAGELCMMEHMLGHAGHQENGIVPLLIVSIARTVLAEHHGVRYFAYGTYFGAGDTMRRFKRKFLFEPHRVKWALG